MINKIFAISLIILLQATIAQSQKPLAFFGHVQDTTHNPIVGASIYVGFEKDSLLLNSDSSGNFKLKFGNYEKIQVTVKSVGFQTWRTVYRKKLINSSYLVDTIILRTSVTNLHEVVIKNPRKGIKLKKDTIEFDAVLYDSSEDDKVFNLLKKLPGITVDGKGNVYSEGKRLQKIRVNGRDFFDGDINQYIQQLPAYIVDKVQIINELSNQTSNNDSNVEPSEKILNLNIKPGMSYGTFGNTGGSLSSAKSVSLLGNANYWRDNKQISGKFQFASAGNNVGITSSNILGLTYKNDLSKSVTLSFNYGFNNTDVKAIDSTSSRTTNLTGEIFSKNKNNSSNVTDAHSIYLSLSFQPDKNNSLSIIPKINLSETRLSNSADFIQTGQINQTNLSETNGQYHNANSSLDINYGHRFRKDGRYLNIIADGTSLNNNDNEDLQNNIDNFNNNRPKTDSLLSRLATEKKYAKNYIVSVNYTEPISKFLTVNIFYNYQSTVTSTTVTVQNAESTGLSPPIDSISYKNILYSKTQNIGFNNHVSINKISANLGLSYLPVSLHQIDLNGSNYNYLKTYNYSPTAGLSYIPNSQQSLNLSYSGSSTLPTNDQLQPTVNNTDPNNITVGNPKLKPSFTDNLAFNYRQIINSTSTLTINVLYQVIKNDIVTNQILVKDESGVDQERIHYDNINGSYKFGSSYFFSSAIFKSETSQTNLNFNGDFSLGTNFFLNNNSRRRNSNQTFSQTASIETDFKKLTLNCLASYNYYSNLLNDNNLATKISSLTLSSSFQWAIFADLSSSIEMKKSITYGLLEADDTDHLLMDISVNKRFFKGKFSCGINATNIFNKKSSILTSIVGNTRVDKSIANSGRIWIVNMIWSFAKFAQHGQ